MSTSLTTSDGNVVENPSQDELANALDTLLSSDNPEVDLWLENDEGWALSVVTTRDVFFENLNDQENYFTLGPLEQDYILRLLHLLSEGKIGALQAEAWERGE